MCEKGLRRFIGIFLSLVLLAVMVGTASGQIFTMTADETTLTMPDGTVVPVWGFTLDGGAVRVPGDCLVVPQGDSTLTINLTNNLDEPVSLNILGQVLTNNTGPVWTDGLTDAVVGDPRGSGNYTARVRSFSHETAPGNVGIYTWASFRPGTYLLTSGTNPAKQVQMGLYAPVKQDAAGGSVAYPGLDPYTKELVLVFHEVDPVLHDAVSAGTYGYSPSPPPGQIPSSLDRNPKYYLINGMGYPDAGLDPINAATPVTNGDRVLMRFLNAGLETHAPQILNTNMDLVAEDGNPYLYPKNEQYGFGLPAGKTVDAILEIGPTTPARLPLYDAVLNLTNAAQSPGGMLAHLAVAGTGADTVDITRAGYNRCNDTFLVRATSSAPGAVLKASFKFGSETIRKRQMTFVAGPNYYEKYFTNVSQQPTSVTVFSDGGGLDIDPVPGPGADTVTILGTVYKPVEQQVIVAATSDAPVGTVKLCASFEIGGVTQIKKQMSYLAGKGYYKRIWKNVAVQPDGVTVTSDGGGSDTQLVPFP
jgi:hypothetical protein